MTSKIGRVPRKLHDRHSRALAPYEFALGGVIVNEDNAGQVNVQLPGDPSEIRRFVLPVAAERGEFFETERHLSMLLKDLRSGGSIILAAHREDHPPRFEFAEI